MEIARSGDIYLRIEDSKLMLVPANDCRIHGRQRPDRLNHVRSLADQVGCQHQLWITSQPSIVLVSVELSCKHGFVMETDL